VLRGDCDARLEQAHQMFYVVASGARRTLKRSTFRSYMTPLRREVERLLEAGSQCGVAQTAGTCREMLRSGVSAFVTFVQVEGVRAHEQHGRTLDPSGMCNGARQLWHAAK